MIGNVIMQITAGLAIAYVLYETYLFVKENHKNDDF